MPFLFEDDQKTIISLDAAMQPLVTRLTTNFQNKINAIYEKLVALGSTPSAKTPEAITNAIQAINDSIYAKLQSLGETPASKKVSDLNAKIQKLTENGYSFTFSKSNSPISDYHFYDCRMMKEVRLTQFTTPLLGDIFVAFTDANFNVLSYSQHLSEVNQTVNFPSGAKFIYFDTSDASSYSIKFTYQTKVLR